MTSYFEKWETSNLKNLTLLNQPNDSSHTALKSEISENGSDRYHFRRTGRTGTISGERVEQVPFRPLQISIGPNEFYFGTFYQFGPNKVQFLK